MYLYNDMSGLCSKETCDVRKWICADWWVGYEVLAILCLLPFFRKRGDGGVVLFSWLME
jgi:hypothetical protein